MEKTLDFPQLELEIYDSSCLPPCPVLFFPLLSSSNSGRKIRKDPGSFFSPAVLYSVAYSSLSYSLSLSP